MLLRCIRLFGICRDIRRIEQQDIDRAPEAFTEWSNKGCQDWFNRHLLQTVQLPRHGLSMETHFVLRAGSFGAPTCMRVDVCGKIHWIVHAKGQSGIGGCRGGMRHVRDEEEPSILPVNALTHPEPELHAFSKRAHTHKIVRTQSPSIFLAATYEGRRHLPPTRPTG